MNEASVRLMVMECKCEDHWKMNHEDHSNAELHLSSGKSLKYRVQGGTSVTVDLQIHGCRDQDFSQFITDQLAMTSEFTLKL